uniref:G-protein coupled receptors family 1 profile domain-containing protein n=1 Tax=Onchocerca volvulus TaxID=6282 RepID=A0A8R1TL93_ONCVO
MDFAVNETTTEDNIVLSNEKYILCSYAYLFVGTLIILISIPAFPLVMIRKALREPYAILVVAFFNSGLTGISAMLVGIKRTIVSNHGEQLVDHHECVLNAPILLLTSYLLNGLSLLMNSMERISVITFPLYYYKHGKRISYSLIAAQYVITITVITSTVIASLIEPTRRVSNFCWLPNVLSRPFLITSLLLTYIASSLSVILTAIAVFIFKKKVGKPVASNLSRNHNLSHFLKNQKRFTQTSIISCCFTFLFVVMPSIVEQINRLETSTVSQIIVMYCVYLRLLNSCNLVIVFFYRQRDLPSIVMRYFRDHFCGRKDHVQSIKTCTNAPIN